MPDFRHAIWRICRKVDEVDSAGCIALAFCTPRFFQSCNTFLSAQFFMFCMTVRFLSSLVSAFVNHSADVSYRTLGES
ncbi:hypothetical protein WJ08_25980 [Burkholderia vietnamiensis]|uniref:Uncharacterized protein n=1 Tax=Burkholderia vietnamiensis TaxID=60552 RepID=A0AA45B9N8_BURVI|nr:hypothetical protein WJ08_25980 [Burkholderia vietnamiensis]KVF39665.1 hypothetical protein WJ10_20345 [Burkholderia vietnamiensis]PRH38220.1 hypothetical protein C6T65_32870 [Burkholderia vietnamiensis]